MINDAFLLDEQERQRLRDEFAMAALTGLLALLAHPGSNGWSDDYATATARSSYVLADAMLKARESHAGDS